MNILAHLYLSFNDPDLMVGNFMGDHVRKRHLAQLPAPISKGVKLHWAIDTFTDTHPIVMESKSRLRPKYHKYSPVLVDMFYDHFLSRDWNQFHQEQLPAFSARFFEAAKARHHLLPETAAHMLPFMESYQWLQGYGAFAGIERALRGMSRRTKFDSGMENAVTDLKADYQQFEKEFLEFFPELEAFCQQWLVTTGRL
jgi:acyl carrier protein phosphodiesterase